MMADTLKHKLWLFCASIVQQTHTHSYTCHLIVASGGAADSSASEEPADKLMINVVPADLQGWLLCMCAFHSGCDPHKLVKAELHSMQACSVHSSSSLVHVHIITVPGN